MPTHPIDRKPGRPITTGSKRERPVHFRVSTAQRAELDAEAKRLGLSSADVAAKRRCFLLPPVPGARVLPAHGQRVWAAYPGESCCQAEPPAEYRETWGLCVKPAGHPRGVDRGIHADIDGRTWRAAK